MLSQKKKWLFGWALLTTQLELFTSSFSQGDGHDKLTFLDVKAHTCSFLTAVRCSMSEVFKNTYGYACN